MILSFEPMNRGDIIRDYPKVKPVDYLTKNPNIFFTSDFHIGDPKILVGDSRPFHNLDDMSETLIQRWNSVVSDDSITYFLGDLSNNCDIEYTKSIVHQLNGEIRFILGNHDNIDTLIRLKRFTDIQTYKQLIIEDNHDTHYIELSHYPLLTWNKSSKGNIHLHGHTHQTISNSEYGNSYYKRMVMDVGCMGHNYTPVSIDQVLDNMINRNTNNHY